MENSCHSCGIPLMGEIGKDYRGNFCSNCSDESGKLLPREEVRQGIADWLIAWAPNKKNIDFSKRAESYMNAMPAWAEE